MTTEQRLLRIAIKLWPDLAAQDASERKRLLGELVGIIYGMLLAVLGISWLILVTDFVMVGAEWPTLLLMLILAAVLNQLDFFWVVERRAGTYDRWSSQLGGLITISTALLFGPTAIWLGT